MIFYFQGQQQQQQDIDIWETQCGGLASNQPRKETLDTGHREGKIAMFKSIAITLYNIAPEV